MKIAATIAITSLIWWGNCGGDTATTTDTAIFLASIITALLIALRAQKNEKNEY